MRAGGRSESGASRVSPVCAVPRRPSLPRRVCIALTWSTRSYPRDASTPRDSRKLVETVKTVYIDGLTNAYNS